MRNRIESLALSCIMVIDYTAFFGGDMKSIALITGSRDTANALLRQLNVFLENQVVMNVYVIDEGIIHTLNEDLLVFSSRTLHDEVASQFSATRKPQIIGNRTVNYDVLDELVSIPHGTKVLLVNDVEESAVEVLNALLEIGLDHMEMTLCYPGCDVTVSNFDIAITPGETQYVPEHIKQVIDIGSRIFDFRTIAKILSQLNLLENSSGSFSKMYLEKIIKIAKGLAVSKSEVLKLNENLERVINSFNAGLLMYDKNFKVVVFNDIFKQLLRISKYAVIGSALNGVIYNKRLLAFLMDENGENRYDLTIDGNEYVVTKFKITNNEMTCASIKSSKIHSLSVDGRESAIKKGHVAKYGLDDIIGQSEAVFKLKAIIKKLSGTDMTILIQGESGTGKELTASAIHKESARAEAPFLAVNFSALPDDLIESELFGYVEGAFTGARKGGKVGLFEEANGGTIFLDEIGDVSLKVQSRLLRVLEEREIMPIGSGEIKPIDVRIIAATNKDLAQLVADKKFREDLYYRLKMGYIQLQPLRQRKEDIPALFDHMMWAMASSQVSYSDVLMNRLTEYDWTGNIRELKNTITYMLAVRESDVLDVCDLPDTSYFGTLSEDKIYDAFRENYRETEVYLNDEQLYFLEMIHRFVKQDKAVSRVTLSDESLKGSHKRSENQVRRILKQLDELGVISLSKGRKGVSLTAIGDQMIHSKL